VAAAAALELKHCTGALHRQCVPPPLFCCTAQVLCTTSTLAMGVNLPAHLVVLKGTVRWAGDTEVLPGDTAGYRSYTQTEVRGHAVWPDERLVRGHQPRLASTPDETCATLFHGVQVLQMVGRAGRPQFDTEGVAVIMTSKDSQGRWQQLLAGQVCVCGGSVCVGGVRHVDLMGCQHSAVQSLTPPTTTCCCCCPPPQVVESCLLTNLPEHLNAEIVLGSIQDVAQAVAWIKSTFLFTRVRANPQHYG
jgi:ATP-dependent DNA helicase HFM1/MER3